MASMNYFDSITSQYKCDIVHFDERRISDLTMAQKKGEKRQTSTYKTLHRKLQIAQHASN